MSKTRFHPEAKEDERADALLWCDSFETVHACRRIDIKEVFLLVTTLCGRNLPPNTHWNTHRKTSVTCPDCDRQKN